MLIKFSIPKLDFPLNPAMLYKIWIDGQPARPMMLDVDCLVHLGLYLGMQVQTQEGKSGVVVGVAEQLLWINLDGDSGATGFANGAQIYIMCFKLYKDIYPYETDVSHKVKRLELTRHQYDFSSSTNHEEKCFYEMLENQKKFSNEYVVFYHSYSYAAMQYEVQTAIASLVHDFNATNAIMPRLLSEFFKEKSDVEEFLPMLDKCGAEYNRRDHHDLFREVGICVTTNLFAEGEASPFKYFQTGYSDTSREWQEGLKNLLRYVGIKQEDIPRVLSAILAIGYDYGLNCHHLGGKFRDKSDQGHLLQIFLRTTIVDQYAYPSLPGGMLDVTRLPFGVCLVRDEDPGQARIIANPEVFRNIQNVHMHLFSANPDFHNNKRKQMQHELQRFFAKELLFLSNNCYKGDLFMFNPQAIEIPLDYICPITQDLLEDPVVAADGHTYERAAIVKWIETGHRTSPMTGDRLSHDTLIPNIRLKSIINDFKEKLPKIMIERQIRIDLAAAIQLREEILKEFLATKGYNQKSSNLHNNLPQAVYQAVPAIDCTVAKVGGYSKFEIKNLATLYSQDPNFYRPSGVFVDAENLGLGKIGLVFNVGTCQNGDKADEILVCYSFHYFYQDFELSTHYWLGYCTAMRTLSESEVIKLRATADNAEFYQQFDVWVLKGEMKPNFYGAEGNIASMHAYVGVPDNIIQLTQEEVLQHREILADRNGKKKVNVFLEHIVNGRQDEAEAMLKRNPALALASGNIKDHADRIFNGITGFQYAVWALDLDMWSMINRYLPVKAAKVQAEGFASGSWVATHGEHFNMRPLFDTLEKYMEKYNPHDHTAHAEYWIHTVGGEQRKLPIHALQQYYNPTRSFAPIPDFAKAGSLPRVTVDHNKLGKEYGIIRATYGHSAVPTQGWATWVEDKLHTDWLVSVSTDLNALEKLYAIRIQQREVLVSELVALCMANDTPGKQVAPVAPGAVLTPQFSAAAASHTTQMPSALRASPTQNVKIKIEDVRNFLENVLQGNKKKVEAMLEKMPALVLCTGDIRDHAGRQFDNITGFQYAVWSLDIDMWATIKHHLQPEAAHEQAKGFKDGKWVTRYGECVNWQQLLDAQQIYDANRTTWPPEQRREYWIKQVCGAQHLLPMHMLNKYCSQFTEMQQSSDFKTGPFGSLFDGYYFDDDNKPLEKPIIISADFGIGVKTAFSSSGYGCGYSYMRLMQGVFWPENILTNLYEARTRQRNTLLAELLNAADSGVYDPNTSKADDAVDKSSKFVMTK